MKVQPHCAVTLSYTVEPADEGPFPFPTGPFRMECLVGHGRLLPPLERAVLGLEEGEYVEVVLKPGEFVQDVACGRIIPVPVEAVAEKGPHPQGSIRHMMDEARRLQPFRVVKQDGGVVWADFSHPFSGRPFRFRIRVEKVRWATLEEIKNAAHDATPH